MDSSPAELSGTEQHISLLDFVATCMNFLKQYFALSFIVALKKIFCFCFASGIFENFSSEIYETSQFLR